MVVSRTRDGVGETILLRENMLTPGNSFAESPLLATAPLVSIGARTADRGSLCRILSSTPYRRTALLLTAPARGRRASPQPPQPESTLPPRESAGHVARRNRSGHITPWLCAPVFVVSESPFRPASVSAFQTAPAPAEAPAPRGVPRTTPAYAPAQTS